MRFEFSKNSVRWIGGSLTLVLFVILQSNTALLKGQTNVVTPNAVAPNRVAPNQVAPSRTPAAAPNPDGSLPIRPGAAVNTGAPDNAAPNNAVVQTTGRTTQSQPLIPNSIPNTGGPGGPRPAGTDAQPNQPGRPQQVLPNNGQPFPQLTVKEAADLDRFLDIWEKKSNQITYFETEFQCWRIGNNNLLGADTSTYGMIRYVAPNIGIFEEIGLVVNNEREAAPPERRTKFLSTGDKIYEYDFVEKQVSIYTIPVDQRDSIAGGGPMPFVFGAKAADLKKRYYLKIIPTPPERANRGETWLEAYPRMPEDAAEYRFVRLIFDEKPLPLGFIQFDTNEKESSSYRFQTKTMKIHTKSLLREQWEKIMKAQFRPDIPAGWTTKEIDAPQVAQSNQPPAQPTPRQQPQPQQQRPQQQQQLQPQNVEETPLYTPPSGGNRPQFD